MILLIMLIFLTVEFGVIFVDFPSPLLQLIIFVVLDRVILLLDIFVIKRIFSWSSLIPLMFRLLKWVLLKLLLVLFKLVFVLFLIIMVVRAQAISGMSATLSLSHTFNFSTIVLSLAARIVIVNLARLVLVILV